MEKESGKLVSVIVPVYNAELWLRQCIESICAQSYPTMEIILIDDGSSDGSLNICRKYSRQDPRIRVISKSNSGVSDTRNLGIEAAAGDYIMFVDADDYLAEDILKQAVDIMCEESVHLCGWNVACVSGEMIREEPAVPEGKIDCGTAVDAVIYNTCASRNLGRYFRASWAKLYRSDVIKANNIRFCTQQHIGEDALFLLEYLKHISSVTMIDTAGYFYRITKHSAVRGYRTDLLQQNQQQLDAICSYLEKDAASVTMRTKTALTCLAWDMFRRLIRNQMMVSLGDEVTKEAKLWYQCNNKIMRQKGVSWKYMPKTTKLQYALSAWLPPDAICDISAALEVRKTANN